MNRLTSQTFDALRSQVSNWGRWGSRDERGALNWITANVTRSALTLVHDGETVSLAKRIDTVLAPDNPHPAVHSEVEQTAGTAEDEPGKDDLRWYSDFLGVDYHGDAQTHLDSLNHCIYRETIFNDLPLANHERGSAETLANGVITRGVLLDLPRLFGVPWLPSGEVVGMDVIAQAEEAQGIELKAGDCILIRWGRFARREHLGPWDVSTGRAGLDPNAMKALRDVGTSILGSDSDCEVRPYVVDGVSWPIHILALHAMGVHLLDNVYLESAAEACSRHQRWEFCFILAPLRIPNGAGSPVNPLAVF